MRLVLERGVTLVDRIIDRMRPHVRVRGGSADVLDAVESRLMVELPPTLRRFLEFDFTFESFGPRWAGVSRFGRDARTARPRVTSVQKLAEAMTDHGFTPVRMRKRIIRLPNLPGQPWNALYLGEARHDGELPILGLVNDESSVHAYVRYTAFDLYLLEQSGLADLGEDHRLDDIESYLALNPELRTLMPDEEPEPTF
jgi:hypothetical protein